MTPEKQAIARDVAGALYVATAVMAASFHAFGMVPGPLLRAVHALTTDVKVNGFQPHHQTEAAALEAFADVEHAITRAYLEQQ